MKAMSQGKWLGCLVLAGVALLAGAGEAVACSCARPSTVLDAYMKAGSIVIFRVESLKKAEAGEEAGAGGVAHTNGVVEKVYKGKLKVGGRLAFVQGSGADCLWTFSEESVGRRYLAYLPPDDGVPMHYLSTCGRSSPVEGAGDDLLYLDNLRKTRGRTRLSGTVEFAEGHPLGAGGLKIRVVGGGKTYEAVTDEQGVYEIYDLPAGRYTVEPELRPGWKINPLASSISPGYAGGVGARPDSPRGLPVVIEARQHAGLDILFEIENAVGGRILDRTGRPMEDVCLRLLPVEDEGPLHFFGLDCTEKAGTFRIDAIPPGRYVLAVNPDGKVTSTEPFGTFYYPNAARREEATVFDIGAGEFVEGLEIHAPVAAETVTVEGVLLYEDGRPAPGQKIAFEPDGAGEDAPEAASTETDARGRFSVKILKGARGRLSGQMYTYPGEYENCPKLDRIIKASGRNSLEIKTPTLEVRADANLYDVELRYPFPACRKAKE